MKARIALTLALVLVHIAFGALALLLHSDRFGRIFVDSIYRPLSVLQQLGLPVFQREGWYIHDLSVLGWIIIGSFWLAIYLLVADVLVRFLGKRRHVA